MAIDSTDQRRLDDKVLQSAEDAVLTERRVLADPVVEGAHEDENGKSPRRSYVASHPLAAALAAALVGALSMVALRSALQRRRTVNERTRP